MKLLKYEYIWEMNIATGHLNCKRAPMKAHENILIFYKRPPEYFPQMQEGKPYVQNYDDRKRCDNYGRMNKPYTHVNTGYRYPRSVLKFNTVTGSPCDGGRRHPQQKPVELLSFLIQTYTRPGALVLDNCMGSGATGQACIETGRNFIGIEKDVNIFLGTSKYLRALEVERGASTAEGRIADRIAA